MGSCDTAGKGLWWNHIWQADHTFKSFCIRCFSRGVSILLIIFPYPFISPSPSKALYGIESTAVISQNVLKLFLKLHEAELWGFKGEC